MIDSLTERERKLLTAAIPALILIGAVYFWPEPSSTVGPVLDKAAAIDTARLRLDQARVTAAQLPAQTEALKKLDANLALWRKRFITADTPAQAQAQLNQTFRRIARLQGPAVEIRNMDIGTVQSLEHHSEIIINVNFDCQIEGLVNLLSDLASQPEFLIWRDIRISSNDSKQKRIGVSMAIVGFTLVKPLTPGVRG
jgi:hypothetical protein